MFTAMMKLSVLLLLALPALSSASLLDIGNNTEQRNASFMNSDLNGSADMTTDRMRPADRPLLTVAKLRQKRQVQSSPLVSDDRSNLEWVTWNNSLPNGAVSIYNGYVDRIDYVCKYKCEAGFYTPSSTVPYCYYANTKKEYSGFPFEILVNKDNFEFLEWKDDSHGSVPQNSVRTCPGEDIYVGKNKYGLGKVSTKDKAFYLPWKGSEYLYHDYQVLTINKNIISQHVYDVRYNINESKIYHYPLEVMRETAISNYECRSVVKTDTLSQTHKVEKRWDITASVKVGVTTTITAGIPEIFSDGIEISTEVTVQASGGNTVTDISDDSLSVEITAPPNHSCTVKMVRYKNKIDIPFTARLSCTYGNGEIHTTSVTGTYNGIQTGEVRAVLDRCELLDKSNPCT